MQEIKVRTPVSVYVNSEDINIDSFFRKGIKVQYIYMNNVPVFLYLNSCASLET